MSEDLIPKVYPPMVERDLPPYLRAVGEKYDRDAEACVHHYLNAMEAAVPPPSLYHYTTTDGLVGILQSGRLRLSDIFSLNDPSELVHAMNVAVRLAKGRAGSEEFKTLANELEEFCSRDGAKAVGNYFVCSFSANGDDLTQWRAYGEGGAGFALEFDTQALETVFTRDGDAPIANHSTFPIDYSEASLETVVERIVDLLNAKIAFARRVMPATKEGYGAYMSSLLLTTALHFYRLSLFFKHPAYVSEGEYRFLSLHGMGEPPNVSVRVRDGQSIRYQELDWRKLAPASLKAIKVGPAADFAVAKKLAADALATCDLGHVAIVQSQIPFRR